VRHWVKLCLVVLGFGSVDVQAQIPTDIYNYSRSSAFTYDAGTGLLKSETVEPNNPNSCITTSYQYDSYGNRTVATTSNCANASGRALFTSRSSSTDFTGQNVVVNGVTVAIPSGAFAATTYNPLNQAESKSYDPRFGTPTKLTGPNGLTTTWEMDDFGRTVREARADGTSTVTAYCYLSSSGIDTSSNSANCPVPTSAEVPTGAVSFVHLEPRDTSNAKSGPFNRVYNDRFGRKLRTVTEAFDAATQPNGANRLIVQDTDYNAQGAPILTTQPYFLDTKMSVNGGTATYGMTRTDYNLLGRPVAIYVTDSKGSSAGVAFGGRGSFQASVTTVSYNSLSITTTNDKGQLRTEEKNVDGKVARVTDHLGAQIAYQYDAFGNLVQTKDALQNVVVTTFDIQGRKKTLVDPDTGTWQYDHNALGELVWQQNANQAAAGQSTTMVYDLLGRMTQKVEPEYTSNWYYDKYADGSACGKSVGKLCETSTSNGIGKKYVYDSIGRAVNTRTTVSNGPSFASAISYSSTNGRPVSQTWPTGLAVNYNYTSNGFLSTVTLATAATVAPLPTTAGAAAGASTSLPAGSVLWQAKAYTAWGKAEEFIYGNNVTTRTAYDPQTGRPLSDTAGVGAGTAVMNYSYAWDSLNHLGTRSDANGDGTTGAVTDSFQYDGIGRLQSYSVNAPAIPNLARTVTMQYNALGMLLAKSDVGNYTYKAQGNGVGQPHALQSVDGALPASYAYDANGNLKTATNGAYRSISYTSFNLPSSVAGPSGGAQYSWQYDENHQRLKEVRVTGSGTRTTWQLHPDNAGGLSFESEQNGSATFNRHYISAGGQAIGVLVSTGALPTLASTQTAPPALGSIALNKVEYWHKDHLGSLVSTTDHTGAVTARYSYDPFGKRRYTNGNYDANGKLVVDWTTDTNNGTDRGWTGHEHLDDVGVVHMNGRTFDPRLGVFMQGDSFVQDPHNLQNFNRYGYCFNNPMTCTDPTGQFFGIDDFIIAVAIIWTAEKLNVIDVKTARMLTSIAFAAVGGPPTTLAEAATTGFVSGAIATGNVKGALQGAFTAGMFYGAGELIHAAELGTASGIAVHGVVGCVTSVTGGGKCGPGALSASFAKAAAPTVNNIAGDDAFAGAMASAVVGGTGAVLGGGKFSNGAMSGAFAYLFNQVGHNNARGKAGEAARLAELESLGAKNIQKQVYLETLTADGTKVRAIADFVYEFDGKIIFEEVKVGLFAKLSSNQIAVYDAIKTGAVAFVDSGIGKSFGVGVGKTLASLSEQRWAVSLIAEVGSRASGQWGRYLLKGAVGAATILGSSYVMAADMLTHTSEAGRYSDCVTGCTLTFKK
jgi:RHS repeat-associated protein